METRHPGRKDAGVLGCAGLAGGFVMWRRAGKFLLLASALAAGGFLALSTTARETVTGSGTRATEQRDFGDVTEVVLSGTGDLVLEPGDAPCLSVTADDNVLPLLVTETDGKKLI